MNIQLLQWGLFSFMLGLILSLPVAAVHYQKSLKWTKIFTNPRKLKSAHLDFFTQAFSAAFVYLLELALKIQFPEYVVVALVFGIICNPLILLIEATPLTRSGFSSVIYNLLRATSPTSLIFAWFSIAWSVLPTYLLLALPVVVLLGVFVIMSYKKTAE
jgi:hypothetical protein